MPNAQCNVFCQFSSPIFNFIVVTAVRICYSYTNVHARNIWLFVCLVFSPNHSVIRHFPFISKMRFLLVFFPIFFWLRPFSLFPFYLSGIYQIDADAGKIDARQKRNIFRKWELYNQ